MDVADMLLDKILSWVELQKKGAAKLKELTTEMEECKKGVNITKVVGSSVSVGGAAAVATAGIVTLCTGGLAIPFLAVAGGVATGVGLATSVTADIVDVVTSSRTMKEAEEVSQKIQNHEEGIQKLTKTLEEEGKRREQQACADGDIPSEDYVVEQILRAMAKRKGLVLNDKIRLCKMLSQQIKSDAFGSRIGLSILYGTAHGLALIEKVLIQELAEDLLIEAAEETGKKVISKGVSKAATSSVVKGASQAATSMAPKVAAKAVGRIAGGALGLAISIPELVISCKNLDNCKTEASKSLRENAEAIQKAAEEFKKNLDEIQETFKRLAKIKSCIENTKRRPDEKEVLTQFAIENCEDKEVQQWLRENSESETFFSLVDLFRLVKEKLDEEEQKDHGNTVDITFLAHGAITGDLIPAKHVLPLSTVSDVVLHSPWNSYLSVDAAYDIAAGFMKPEHREFLCCGKGCRIPSKDHRPPNLPNHWNSMKKAVEKGQQIPDIRLSPVGRPKDRAWESFEILTWLGPLGKNHIIVPYVIPEKWSSESPQRVPFSAVSLALGLVLMFSRFTATVHLTACLGKLSARQKLDREYLEKQYSCTIDNTGMTSSCPATHTNKQLLKMVELIFGKSGKPGKPGSCLLS